MVQLVFIIMRKSDLFGFQIQSFCLVRRQKSVFYLPSASVSNWRSLNAHSFQLCKDSYRTALKWISRPHLWEDCNDRPELVKFPLTVQALKHPLASLVYYSERIQPQGILTQAMALQSVTNEFHIIWFFPALFSNAAESRLPVHF